MDFDLKVPSSRIHRADDNPFSWVSPPLDGSLTVAELYDFHYAHNPEHPVFRFVQDNAIKELRFREVIPAAYTAARLIAKSLGIDIDDGHRLPSTVAVLVSSDTITSFTTIIGMLRADITFFIISPYHSPASISRLLSSTSISHFLVGQEWRELAEAAIQLLEGTKPIICKFPTYLELYTSENAFTPLFYDPRRKDWNVTRYLLHSSGTTSHPKPVARTDRALLQVATVALHGERDLLGELFGCFGLMMHHGSGSHLIGFLATTGLIMATFTPGVVEVKQSLEQKIWDAALAIKPTFLYGMPGRLIEAWSRDPAKLPFLEQLTGGIVFAGAPLNKAVGDTLARNGCIIHTVYGSTEVGPQSRLFLEDPGMSWEYFEPNPLCHVEFLPQEDGKFELVIVDSPTMRLSIVDTTFNGRPAFRTKDMVEPHPTLPNRWKILGRLDDRIVLTAGNGKTIPGPIEEMICKDPQIRSAVMFGTGKSHNGVLIELESEYALGVLSPSMRKQMLDSVWPAIEVANDFAHYNARIPRDLVGFAVSSHPFEYSAKGQPKRAAILAAYHDDIEALYLTFEEKLRGQTKESDIKASSSSNRGSIGAKLRARLGGVTRQDVRKDWMRLARRVFNRTDCSKSLQ